MLDSFLYCSVYVVFQSVKVVW